MGNERVILERRFVPKGSLIIEQGDQAWCAYLIQSGRVSVYYKDGDKKVELAELGPGQICGEMALIKKDIIKRSANVRAIEDSNLIVITHNMFEEKLKKSDPTIQAIIKMLVDRVNSTNDVVIEKQNTPAALVKLIERLYENVHDAIDAKKQKSFEKSVLAKKDAFIQAIEPFTKTTKK